MLRFNKNLFIHPNDQNNNLKSRCRWIKYHFYKPLEEFFFFGGSNKINIFFFFVNGSNIYLNFKFYVLRRTSVKISNFILLNFYETGFIILYVRHDNLQFRVKLNSCFLYTILSFDIPIDGVTLTIKTKVACRYT